MSGPMSAPPPVRRTSGAMAAVMTNDDPLAADAGEASFELAVGPGDIGMPPGMSSGLSTPPGSLPKPSFNPGPLSNPPTSAGISGSMPRVSAPPHDPSNPDVRLSRPPAEPEPPRVDALEARAFADYGEPPAGALQSPIYAFRVKMRQSELRRGLWRAKIAFERAQKDQAKALADPSRLDEVKARLAVDVEAKERDVDVHEAALDAFDAAAVKRGMTLAFSAAAFLFIVIFVPVFFRMCVGVDAPSLIPNSQ
ncbi:MAG: hypothetical protein ABI461_09675 [Polyangiaceae bacterium]